MQPDILTPILACEIHDPAEAGFANTARVVYDQTSAADYPTNVLSLVTLNTGSGHFDNANPFQTIQAFKQKTLSLRIRFVGNNLFVSLEKQGGFWRIKSARCNIEAPVLVNCAGAWGDQIAAMLGDPVPLEAQALMLIITDRPKPFVKPVVSVQGRSLSFKQFYNGTVLIGGAFRGRAEPEYNRTHLGPRGFAANAANAAFVFSERTNHALLGRDCRTHGGRHSGDWRKHRRRCIPCIWVFRTWFCILAQRRQNRSRSDHQGYNQSAHRRIFR
ncbi:MAG: FAD-dependent oxidoreductase [Alphaproteobacteria bacterium]